MLHLVDSFNVFLGRLPMLIERHTRRRTDSIYLVYSGRSFPMRPGPGTDAVLPLSVKGAYRQRQTFQAEIYVDIMKDGKA